MKGDWRIDFGLPTRHTLGQSFTATVAWRRVQLKLGNTGHAPAQAVVTLRRDGPAGPELTSQRVTLAPHSDREVVGLDLETPVSPGTYYVELSDAESGRKWDGSLCWWTDPDTDYTSGDAYNGPFQGDLWKLLQLLFDYGYEFFGPRTHGVAVYDQAMGCGPNKSGRIGDPIVCVSYWEQFGGGKDMWSSLWYPSACSAMAELARWQGLSDEARHYDTLRQDADIAFRSTFGRDVEEHGQPFFRYVAVVDWDGKTHDYGHAHYNLEAVARGIADQRDGQRILQWLDRGQLSPDGGNTWVPDIYSWWQIAPPFITVNNLDWQGLGGTPGGFPYGSVLAAGGTRLGTAAVDIQARARVLGIDNAWQRVLQILDRYARPDRLTGGRVFADSGGRGRWHFGPPQLERADIEGFREIFPDNGAVATALPIALLGLEPTAKGLQLTPQVPSSLEGYEVRGLGYGAAVWNIRTRAIRDAGAPPRVSLVVSQIAGTLPTWSVHTDDGIHQPGADTPVVEVEVPEGGHVWLRGWGPEAVGWRLQACAGLHCHIAHVPIVRPKWVFSRSMHRATSASGLFCRQQPLLDHECGQLVETRTCQTGPIEQHQSAFDKIIQCPAPLVPHHPPYKRQGKICVHEDFGVVVACGARHIGSHQAGDTRATQLPYRVDLRRRQSQFTRETHLAVPPAPRATWDTLLRRGSRDLASSSGRE